MQQERSHQEVGAYRIQLLLAQDRLRSIYNCRIVVDPLGNPVCFPASSFPISLLEGQLSKENVWEDVGGDQNSSSGLKRGSAARDLVIYTWLHCCQGWMSPGPSTLSVWGQGWLYLFKHLSVSVLGQNQRLSCCKKNTEQLGPRFKTFLHFYLDLGNIEFQNYLQPGSRGFLMTSELTLKIAMGPKIIRAAWRPLLIAP